MVIWQRLLITIITMLVVSFIAQLIWQNTFDTQIPGYFAGLIGGLAALPIWELLGKIRAKKSSTLDH
jgi:hypothetical protein